MEKNCPIITITETNDKKAVISAIYNEGSHPAIIRAKILKEPMMIDGVNGKEGELMMTAINDKNYGKLDNSGNLLITTEDDDAKNYYIENLDLMYNGGN